MNERIKNLEKVRDMVGIWLFALTIMLGLLFYSYINFSTTSDRKFFELRGELENLKNQYTLLETTATDEFDTIAEQRVQDAISFWIISLNKSQTEDLEKTIRRIGEEHIDLECMNDAIDYLMDKNSFRLYTQTFNDFVDIEPKGITCWKDWKEVDCKEFCEVDQD